MNPRLNVRLHELALLYCAAIWGSTFYIVKASLAGIHPLALVGWRFTIAALLMLPWLWWGRRPERGSPGPPSVAPDSKYARLATRAPRYGDSPTPLQAWMGVFVHWPAGLLLGTVLAALYAAQTYGLRYTTAANSAFITGLFVIFIPPLGWLLFRSVPLPARLLAVAIAVAGLYLLTGGPRGLNRGDLLTLIAAATYALQVLVAGRVLARGVDPLTLAFQQMLACGLLSLLAGVLIHAPLLPATHSTVWAVVFLTLFPTLSAYLLQMLGQRRVDALRVALIFTMEPVFGALFAWTLGGEAFVPLRALGGLLIILAMLVSEVGVTVRGEPSST